MLSNWVNSPATTPVCYTLNPTTPPSNARNSVTSRLQLSQPTLPPESERETPKVKAKEEKKETVSHTTNPTGKRGPPQAPIPKGKERDEDEETERTSPALIVTK
jgi:hypothetical protein